MSAAWNVLKWTNEPEQTDPAILLQCECGFLGHVPSAHTDGVKLVRHDENGIMHFEPQSFLPGPHWLPDEIACPKCGQALITLCGEEEITL